MKKWWTRPRFSMLYAVCWLAFYIVLTGVIQELVDEYGWWWF